MNIRSLRYYLIGESALLVQCAEVLLQQGQTIIGVTSNDPSVIAWCHGSQIPVLISLETTLAAASDLPHFDYLFSISNRYILPPKLLRLPKQLAINYHNAPLPRYAGRNAPAWAILEGCCSFGITWHVMTPQVDAGDIVKQIEFLIESDDTFLSLTLKSHQYALQAFTELCFDILQNRVIRRKQELTLRSYHSLCQRIPGNGLIDWNQSSDEIDRYFRALSFGIYENPLGSIKFLCGKNIFFSRSLSVTSNCSNTLPGTITQISEDYIQVATGTFDIVITDVISWNNVARPIKTWVKENNLSVNSLLPTPTKEQMMNLTRMSASLAKYEPFWVEELAKMIPCTSPSRSYQPILESHALKSINTKNLINIGKGAIAAIDFLLASFLVYLYRMNNYQDYSIYFTDYHLSKDISEAHVFSRYVPLNVSLFANMSIQEAFQVILKKIEAIRRAKTYLNDIGLRYPQLQEKMISLRPYILLDIICPHETDIEISEDANLLIQIAADGSFLKMHYKSPSDHFLTALFYNIDSGFKALLESIHPYSNQPLFQLPIISPKEHEKIMDHWNTSTPGFASEENILKWFEQQVEKNPDHTAIVFQGENITYKFLKKQINQLVFLLKKISVQPGEFVAIYLENEPLAVIAWLAALKLATVYLPMDINYSHEHIRHILNDSYAKVILTHQIFINKLRQALQDDFKNYKVIDLSSEEMQLNQFPSHDILENEKPIQGLAYAIYTSGSTGMPKGVLIEQHGFLNLICASQKKFCIDQKLCILQAASLSFDASIWEMGLALLSGGTLVIPKKSDLLPQTIISFLEEHHVTLAAFTASYLTQIKPKKIKHLQYLMTVGESITPDIIQTWENHVHLINSYGTSETTGGSTFSDPLIHSQPAGIGRPIANCPVYILDELQQLLPPLVMGEIYIGGIGVARGYLNKPELNSLKFLHNPFNKKYSGKMYRTGDLGYWDAGGELYFIGRNDNLVKINGRRVELGAIEAALLKHPVIEQCTVHTTGNNLQKSLIAYLVKKSKLSIYAEELRTFLKDTLPSFMMPTYFIFLEKLPLSVNGKIDKNALPMPEYNLNPNKKPHILPRNKVEKKISVIWEKILKQKDSGIYEDFFESGGHSLLVLQVIIEVEKIFQLKIPPEQFLQNPTIENLAQLITKKQGESRSFLASESLIVTDLILDKKIIPHTNVSADCSPKCVLLTGVTGFLGAHILHELYHSTSSRIYCLIRADNLSAAKFKLQQHILHYKLNKQLLSSPRIIPIIGDLEQPQLALSCSLLDELANNVDIIIHAAAKINHVSNYQSLRLANVLSVHQLLNLAVTGKTKHVYYISSLAAGWKSHAGYVDESFPSPNPGKIKATNGYLLSKQVAEMILAQAHQRKIPITICRLGWIVNHQETGLMPLVKNHNILLLKSFVEQKKAPTWGSSVDDMLPVDFISQFIVRSIWQADTIGKVFNLANPLAPTWQDLIIELQNRDFLIQVLPPEVWQKQIFSDEMSATDPLYPLAALYRNMDFVTQKNQSIKYQLKQSTEVAKQLSLYWPTKEQLVKKCIDFLEQYILPSSHKQKMLDTLIS